MCIRDRGKHTDTACFVLGGMDSPMVLDIIFSSVRLLFPAYVALASANEFHYVHSTIVMYPEYMTNFRPSCCKMQKALS